MLSTRRGEAGARWGKPQTASAMRLQKSFDKEDIFLSGLMSGLHFKEQEAIKRQGKEVFIKRSPWALGSERTKRIFMVREARSLV